MTDFIDKSFDSFCDSIGFESQGGARDAATSKARARFERQCDLFTIAFEDAMEVISAIDGAAYAEALMDRVLVLRNSRRAKSGIHDEFIPRH